MDRGTLEVGKKADINVIDLARLRIQHPRVSYELPTGAKIWTQDIVGYDYTIISGVVTFKDNQPTGALPGRLVRNPRTQRVRDTTERAGDRPSLGVFRKRGTSVSSSFALNLTLSHSEETRVSSVARQSLAHGAHLHDFVAKRDDQLLKDLAFVDTVRLFVHALKVFVDLVSELRWHLLDLHVGSDDPHLLAMLLPQHRHLDEDRRDLRDHERLEEQPDDELCGGAERGPCVTRATARTRRARAAGGAR